MYAESYRNLRSALLFLPNEGARPKVLLITSAVPDEGKSTVAANLARALALGGSRVLLVDADLRKGCLHQLMGLQSEPGLAEALQDPKRLESVVQADSIPNFAFLSRGEAPGNSGDLFIGRSFDELLARFRERFDFVIIDSCPVFAADDATTLAPKVDATLFVVRSRFSRARPVREALELLFQRQARVLGLVFNRADASARSYYYYKYADYEKTLKR
jgi:capsular exopolysaccharide synthesis family protein